MHRFVCWCPRVLAKPRERTARWGMGRAVVLLLLLAGFYNFLLNQRSTLAVVITGARTLLAAGLRPLNWQKSRSAPHTSHRPAFFIKKSLASLMFDNPSHRFFPSLFLPSPWHRPSWWLARFGERYEKI